MLHGGAFFPLFVVDVVAGSPSRRPSPSRVAAGLLVDLLPTPRGARTSPARICSVLGPSPANPHGDFSPTVRRMAPRRPRTEHIGDRSRILEDLIAEHEIRMSQKIKQAVQLAVSRMHQGPSNPMPTSPSEQQSSCGSVCLPEMDWAHYPVDDITLQQPCQLHVQVCNISIKVALGMAYPVEPGLIFNGSKIPPGYSRVRLDEVCAGFDELDMVYPEYKGLTKLREAVHKVILWRKRYIIFGINCNDKSSSPPRDLRYSNLSRSRSPTPPPAPHKENLQSPRSEELVDEAHHDAQCDEHDASADNEDHDHVDEDENLLVHRHAAVPNIRRTRNDDAPCFAHDTLVGKDVILYAMLRSDLPVAKGTIISTDPSTMLGGQSLGRQFCEVIVNLVLKKDAFLPRPYANMETMVDAYMMSIAWPYKKLKVSNKASRLSKGTA